MRKLFLLLFVFPLFLAETNAQQSSTPATTPPAARWIVELDFIGTPVNSTLNLKQDGNKFTGDFDGDKLEGTLTGDSLHFLAKDDQGGSEEATATLKGDTLSGKITFIDSTNPTHPITMPFTAKLATPHHPGTPQRHEFTPTVFYRQFSPHNKPVLTVNPGDTIHTTTVDAGGTDEKGAGRVLGGNPETGPFYIETAVPGDTLVVHLNRVRLNRDWALSDDFVVGRALNNDLAVKMKDGGKSVRWHLDTEHGVATLEKPTEHLTHYSVPLKPMMGCIATTSRIASAPPSTGDSGGYGGNMDFNEIVEGATVYLPVNVTGAFMYIGDGHAAQGDGELNGNALETSMDVEFTVDIIPAKGVPGPRVVSPTHIIAMGLGGSLEDALRDATSNMADWLTDDYKLTPSELAEVLGTATEYKISELADRNVGIVLKINKDRLQTLAVAAK
ncbi:MAG TPA: acetamidase/formamidase family protein [Candidatus Acidoferrum sp.]|jgi:acetamidase/formamidase